MLTPDPDPRKTYQRARAHCDGEWVALQKYAHVIQHMAQFGPQDPTEGQLMARCFALVSNELTLRRNDPDNPQPMRVI